MKTGAIEQVGQVHFGNIEHMGKVDTNPTFQRRQNTIIDSINHSVKHNIPDLKNIPTKPIYIHIPVKNKNHLKKSFTQRSITHHAHLHSHGKKEETDDDNINLISNLKSKL